MFYGTWAEDPGLPVKIPSGTIGWAGHNNCSSALIGGYGYLSVKWEQTQKFAPILFSIPGKNVDPGYLASLLPSGVH